LSAMSGSGDPAPISFSASAASWSGTAGRTISQPASFKAAIWLSVARTSRVSVLVMVWTAIGAAPPTTTSPTRTGTVLRRSFRIPRVTGSGPLPKARELVGHDPLYIEVGDEGGQHQDGRQAGPLHGHLLGAVEGAPPNRLQQDDHDPASVQRRQRQQVRQPQRHRQDGRHAEPVQEAGQRGVVGDGRDSDGAGRALGTEEAAGDLAG